MTVQNIFCRPTSFKYFMNYFLWLKSHLISHVLSRVPSLIYLVFSAPTMNGKKGDYSYYSAPFTLKSLKNILINIRKWLLHKVFDKLLCISYLTVLCPRIAVYMLISQLNVNSGASHKVMFIYKLVKLSTLLLLTLQEIYGHDDFMSS